MTTSRFTRRCCWSVSDSKRKDKKKCVQKNLQAILQQYKSFIFVDVWSHVFPLARSLFLPPPPSTST